MLPFLDDQQEVEKECEDQESEGGDPKKEDRGKLDAQVR